MKKIFYIFVLLFVVSLISFNSCNMVWDMDTTDSISSVSTKPVIEVLGEPIISIEKGQTYVDAGIKVEAGDNTFGSGIEEGAEVNANEIGYYVVAYWATNQYDWTSYAYRAVLVHDGIPYGDDISGDYKVGNYNPNTGGYQFQTQIRKYTGIEEEGYWEIDNVWIEDNVNIPLVFADKGDGNYGVVPVEDDSKGILFGTAKIINDDGDIEFNLQVHGKSGTILNKNFVWERR